jgi:hypothetical protein
MTLNEIIYNIAGVVNRENDLSFLEQLKFKVKYYRALLVRRDQQRNRFLAPQLIQTLPAVALVKVDSAEHSAVNVECSILRSIHPIPKPIRLKGSNAFTYVGTVDKLREYGEILASQVAYVSQSKFTKDVPRYYYINDHVYILNANPTHISIQGVFEDPEAASMFGDTETEFLYHDDMEFPVPADMVQQITQAILSTELGVQTPQDDNNEVKIDG